MTEPVHATMARFSPTMSMSDDAGKLLCFVQANFIMLPIRSQHALELPYFGNGGAIWRRATPIAVYGILWDHLG